MIVAQRKYYDAEQEAYHVGEKQNKEISNKNSKKMKALHKVQIIFSIMFIACLCIGILLGYVRLTELKYQVHYLNKEAMQLEAHIENLKVEVESVKRSDMIEQKAKVELGLQYPQKEQMIFLEVDPNLTMEESNIVKQNEETDKENLIAGVKKSIYRIYTLLD